MPKSYIYTYQTICNKNGKSYIGVHTTNHIDDGYIGCGIFRDNSAKKHLLFHKAVRKYGYASFTRHILSFFDTYKEALEEEKYLVNKKWVLDKNNYNTAIGGNSGMFMYSFSEERKKEVYKKVSESLKGKICSKETRNKISKKSTGRKLSESHIKLLKDNNAKYWAGKKRSKFVCDAISKSKKGKPLSDEHIKKLSESHKGLESKRKVSILQYDCNGYLIKEYDSITDAAKSVNCLRTSISNNLNKKTRLCNGFVFKYKKEVVNGN